MPASLYRHAVIPLSPDKTITQTTFSALLVPQSCVLCFPFASGEMKGIEMSLESIAPQVKKEITKLAQTLRLLEGTAVKQTKAQAQAISAHHVGLGS